MHVTTSIACAADVTLVAVRATNTTDRAQRVRLANTLDGPVYPPRRGGRPAPGWDDGGYEGVFDAGQTRTLGYATPAAPPESETDAGAEAVEVAWTEPAPDGPPTDRAAPGVVLAELGDPRPPRDALPEYQLTEIPPAVGDWLDRVETRILADEATPADRETLDRVVARATDLRRTGWPR